METKFKTKNRLMSIVLTAKLIDAYKKETCLWKKKSPNYGNLNEMNDALQRLATFLQGEGVDANEEFVKNKLNTLNCCWRYEYNKMQKPSNGFKYKTTLWYYDLLLFANDDNTEINDYPLYNIVTEIGTNNLCFKDNIVECKKDPNSDDHIIAPLTSQKSEDNVLHSIQDQKETICLFRKSISDISELSNWDEYDAFGLILSERLRRIGAVSSKQQILCENLLNLLLLAAYRGQLTNKSQIMF